MSDWIVFVTSRGTTRRQLILVEAVPVLEDAERLAFLKLGIDPANKGEYEARAESIDKRVSPSDPSDSLVRTYTQIAAELGQARQARLDAEQSAADLLLRAEKAEDECRRLSDRDALTLGNIEEVRVTLDVMEIRLKKRKR